MKLPKLIIGEIYYCKVFNKEYLFRYESKSGGVYHIQFNKPYYSDLSWDFWTDKTLTEIEIASSEQKHWLNECIKINKYISYDEAILSYITNTKDDPELSNILIKLLTQ